MMNPIAPYFGSNVSNRNIVAPVCNVPSVEMNPYFTRNQQQKRENTNNANHRPFHNSQAFNPYFAVHVLVEAGETDEIDTKRGFAAYNGARPVIKNTLAVA